MFNYTVFTSPNPVGKKVYFNSRGDFIKDNVHFSTGKSTLVTCESIADFAEHKKACSVNQCFCYGINVHGNSIIVPKHLEQTAGIGDDKKVSRTKSNFSFSNGPGIFTIDYDPDPDSEEILSKEELLVALYESWPGLEDAPHMWCPSSGSNLYRDAGDGEYELVNLSGIKHTGQRVYVVINSMNHSHDVMNLLFNRLWINGYGYYFVDRAGRMHERTIFDKAVISPERIDYVGGAICANTYPEMGGGIVQLDLDDEIEVFNPNALPFDALENMHALNSKELAMLDDIKISKMQEKREIAHLKRIKWANDIVEKQNIDNEDLKSAVISKYVDMAKTNSLYGDFELFTNDAKVVHDSCESIHGKGIRGVLVGDILTNRDKWNGVSFFDPFEPEYGSFRVVAKAFLFKGNRPIINSFAHGGIVYNLFNQTKEIVIEDGNEKDIVDKIIDISSKSGMFYNFSGQLVKLYFPEGKCSPKRMEGEHLGVHLSDIIKFTKFDGRKGKGKGGSIGNGKKICNCPDRIARSVERDGPPSNKFPMLRSTSVCPVIDLNGRVSNVHGYDTISKIYTDCPNWNLPSFNNITDEMAYNALRILWSPLSRYRFKDAASAGGALAMLLTAICRRSLDFAPGFLVDAPSRGSGKTMLTLLTGMLVKRESVGVISMRSDDELQKLVIANCIDDSGCFIIDNITGKFSSDFISSLLTSEYVSGRLLGKSKSLTFKNNLMCMFTGNGMSIDDDLRRKTIHVEIRPHGDNPSSVKFSFNPLDVVRSNFEAIFNAGLLLLKYRVQKGSVSMGVSGEKWNPQSTMGTFDKWSGFIGGAVELCGMLIDSYNGNEIGENGFIDRGSVGVVGIDGSVSGSLSINVDRSIVDRENGRVRFHGIDNRSYWNFRLPEIKSPVVKNNVDVKSVHYDPMLNTFVLDIWKYHRFNSFKSSDLANNVEFLRANRSFFAMKNISSKSVDELIKSDGTMHSKTFTGFLHSYLEGLPVYFSKKVLNELADSVGEQMSVFNNGVRPGVPGDNKVSGGSGSGRIDIGDSEGVYFVLDEVPYYGRKNRAKEYSLNVVRIEDMNDVR